MDDSTVLLSPNSFFTQPIANRLTDETWREMLASGTLLPARPRWTLSFRRPVEVKPAASPTGDRAGETLLLRILRRPPDVVPDGYTDSRGR